MTSKVVPLKQHNIQLRITLEILKQCSSNLAPAFLAAIRSSLCFSCSMYRSILRLVVLAPHDWNFYVP